MESTPEVKISLIVLPCYEFASSFNAHSITFVFEISVLASFPTCFAHIRTYVYVILVKKMFCKQLLNYAILPNAVRNVHKKIVMHMTTCIRYIVTYVHIIPVAMATNILIPGAL